MTADAKLIVLIVNCQLIQLIELKYLELVLELI